MGETARYWHIRYAVTFVLVAIVLGLLVVTSSGGTFHNYALG